MVHAYNPSTWEAEAKGLSLKYSMKKKLLKVVFRENVKGLFLENYPLANRCFHHHVSHAFSLRVPPIITRTVRRYTYCLVSVDFDHHHVHSIRNRRESNKYTLYGSHAGIITPVTFY
jgi:hypothetical protein